MKGGRKMYRIKFVIIGMLVASLAGFACVSSEESTAPDLSLNETARPVAETPPGQLDLEREELNLFELQEFQVIRNMYQIQRGFERFAELNNGVYPTHDTATTPQGKRLKELLPGGNYPTNPFTGGATQFSWNIGPLPDPGKIAATTATEDVYIIRGYGSDPSSLLDHILTND